MNQTDKYVGTTDKTGNVETHRMRQDAGIIIKKTIEDALPVKAVREALESLEFKKPVSVIAIGKAAWKMADEATRIMESRIEKGIVVTKYGHSEGEIKGFSILESAHPIPDENSLHAAGEVLKFADSLTDKDEVLLLLSGGGSSLVEMPAGQLTLTELAEVTEKLLKCSAGIVEMNTVRKHLSAVKGGKLAQRLMPAGGNAIILSDVLGNRPEMIASGMTYPDGTDGMDALKVLNKYHIKISENVLHTLESSKPVYTDNIRNIVKGSVEELCKAAARHAFCLGYTPYIVSTQVESEAVKLGEWFSGEAENIKAGRGSRRPPCAVIAGGETVVKVTGRGMGGRNQEIALKGAEGIRGMDRTVLFSLASDGTDGVTDAAGGIVDGNTARLLEAAGTDIRSVLAENDSYHALQKADGLIITGPTGTNVNDVTVLLMK